MDNNEVKALVEAFKSYRSLLTPIGDNLNSFLETYNSTKDSIDNLNSAFTSGIKENLSAIYKNLSAQAEKASDLSSRIDQFVRVSNKFVSDIEKMSQVFSRMEERVRSLQEIEKKAEEQIGRLDTLLEEKSKSYNVRDLQKTLDSYNSNVEKVSEFINKDVGDILTESRNKLQIINKDVVQLVENQKGENQTLEKLLETYKTSVAFLREITQKQDVNEAYLFDILDKWAEERKVKINKK